MHGRIVSVEVKPEDIGAATKLYAESVIPAAQREDGFRGAMLFTDAITGKAVSITLWDSEEDLLIGQKSGYYQEQIEKFADLLVRKPDQAGYELACNIQVQI